MTAKFTPILLLAVLAIGCKSGDATTSESNNSSPKIAPAPKKEATGNSIVGSWTASNDKMKDGTAEFKEDGTLTAGGSVSKGVSGERTGTYKLEGDKLTITWTGATFKADDTASDEDKKQVEAMNKAVLEEVKKLPPDVNTVTWKDANTFTLTDPDRKTTTFTRKA